MVLNKDPCFSLLHLLFALVEAAGSGEATLRRLDGYRTHERPAMNAFQVELNIDENLECARCRLAAGCHRCLHGNGNPKDHALSKEQDIHEHEGGTRIR